jgi:iron(III) transport system substrate-binding protein
LSKAPHPNAATLYYDFMLTEGQKILSDNKAVTTNKRDQPLLAKFKPVYMNSEQVLDSDEKWQKIYDDTLNGRIAAR